MKCYLWTSSHPLLLTAVAPQKCTLSLRRLTNRSVILPPIQPKSKNGKQKHPGWQVQNLSESYTLGVLELREELCFRVDAGLLVKNMADVSGKAEGKGAAAGQSPGLAMQEMGDIRDPSLSLTFLPIASSERRRSFSGNLQIPLLFGLLFLLPALLGVVIVEGISLLDVFQVQTCYAF